MQLPLDLGTTIDTIVWSMNVMATAKIMAAENPVATLQTALAHTTSLLEAVVTPLHEPPSPRGRRYALVYQTPTTGARTWAHGECRAD